MAISDGNGIPVAIYLASAWPHEVTILAEPAVAKRFVADRPARLIGDRAYDRDSLDAKLDIDYGIELIVPDRLSVWGERPRTQDGRVLRR